MPRFFIFLFLLINLSNSFADTSGQCIDSLDIKIKASRDTSQLIDLKVQKARLLKYSDSKKAEKIILEALESSKNNNVRYSEALCYLLLSDLYGEVSLDFSIDLINKAEQINKGLKDSALYMTILLEKGNLHNTHENHSKALGFYRERYIIGRKLKDTASLGATLNNIGMIYAYQGAFDSALHYFYRSIQLPVKYVNPRNKLNTLGNIAGVYLNINEYDSSRLYYNKTMKMVVEYNNLHRKGWLYNIYSNIFYRLNNYDSAKWYAQEGLKLGLAYGNGDAIEYGYKNLSQIYIQQSVSDSALFYQELYNSYKDSIRIERSKSTLELSIMQKELELRLEKEALEAQQVRNRLIISIVFSVLLFSLLLFALYSNIQKHRRQLAEKKLLELEKKKLEDEINTANRKITSHLMNIISKNNLIEQLVKKLANHPIGFKKENQPLINEVVSELRLSLNVNLWEEFEMRFTEVHPKFYNALKTKHSSLTPAELKLCAFLKMNMSTKEIAAILLLNAKSVEKARIRLRKKLDISNTDVNLNEYLMQF
jgi:DNA-binding CsgD family transcriptional regulator